MHQHNISYFLYVHKVKKIEVTRSTMASHHHHHFQGPVWPSPRLLSFAGLQELRVAPSRTVCTARTRPGGLAATEARLW